MSWHFLPEAAALFGHQPSLDTASSAPSKLKRSKDRCYSQGSETARSLCFRCGTTSAPSTAGPGVEPWISSLAGSPAPTSAWPGREPGSTARSPASGAKWSASLPKCSRALSSWRTSGPLFPGDSTEFSGAWPISGSMRSGTVFERPTWALRTKERDSSSWPTAQAHDAKGPKTPEQIAKMRAKGFGVRNLNEASTQWTTPTATERSGQGKHNRALRLDAQAWQTPGTDSFRSRGGDRKDEMGLDQQARFWPTPVANDDNKTPEAHMAMKARMPGGPRNTITSLNVLIQAWPTPTSSMTTGAGAQGRDGGLNLQTAAGTWPTPTNSIATPEDLEQARYAGNGGNRPIYAEASRPAPTTPTDGTPTSPKVVLNPEFVEALMGWPIGASGLQPLATGGFRRLRHWLSAFCINA